MAEESYAYGLVPGNGVFTNPNVWAPVLGAPPRSGQNQKLVITGGNLTVPAGQAWEDFDASVLGNAAIAFNGVTFGNESELTQTAPDVTYTVANGSLNNFGNIDIGGSGTQATARFNLQGTSFINNGPIEVDGNFLVTGFGTFVNNSTFTIENGIAQFQGAGGNNAGSYVIDKGGTLSFTGFTSAAVSFASGENGAPVNGTLVIGSPFAATTLKTVKGFDQGDTIIVPGQGAAVSWVQATPDSGFLNVGGPGGTVVASIPFSGAYDPTAFVIAPNPATNTTTITTTKVTQPPLIGKASEKPTGSALETTDPVLNLDFYGFRDVKTKTVAGPNDVTLELSKLTIRDAALQRADFLDGSLIFDGTSPQGRYDPDENASQIARMYYTVLGRAPEFGGAHFWVEQQMEARNLSIRDLAPGFYTSPEFKGRYGENTSDQQFVSLLYRNVLDREGDPGGINFWTGNLASGTANRSDVVLGISESYEHQAKRFAVIEQNGIQFFGDPFL